MSKPKIIKDYDNLSQEIQEQIKLYYPYGFDRKLISFKNANGQFVSALPFDTDDHIYLVRMTKAEAAEIVEEDSDYDDEGNLRESVMDEYAEKYEGEEE